jgi:hypothetical protein
VKKLIKRPSKCLSGTKGVLRHTYVFSVCVCVWFVCLSYLFFLFFPVWVEYVLGTTLSQSIAQQQETWCCCESARALWGPHIFENLKNTIFPLGGFQSSLHTHTHICPDFRLRIKMYNNWFQPTIRDEFGQKIFGILVVVVVALMRVDRENSPRNGRDTSFFLISWLWLYYKSWNWVRRYIDTCVRPIIFI